MMKAASPSEVELRFVSTQHALQQLARFRYEIYVEEMGRPQPDADHSRKMILDHSDEGAYVIAAWMDKQIVGTVRVNFCGLSDIGPYEDWYDARTIAGSHWPHATAIITRLMVSPAYRGSILSTRLCTQVFQLGLVKGIGCALMDCNEHLITYFQKLGWRTEGSFFHPDYGVVFTHSFDLSDTGHLAQVRSPFLRRLRRSLAAEHRSLARVSPLSPAVVRKVAKRGFENSASPQSLAA